MADVVNTNVFDVNKKFVDVTGLGYFWTLAKAYVDAADKALADRAAALEATVDGTEAAEYADGLVAKVAALRSDYDALGAEGGIQGMIDATIQGLDVEDAEVEGEYVTAVSETDGKISVSRKALPDWTDAINDAAADALESAKAYTDEVAGAYATEDAEATGLRAEIAAVAADAKSYSIAAVSGDELAALGANVKEAYKLVDEDDAKSGEYIKIYKDSALQSVALNENQELVFTYLLADGSESVVPVSVATFLAESEFADGLSVNSETGVVSVKIDAASESFLTVGADGVKLAGVQDAIDAAAKVVADDLADLAEVVGAPATDDAEATGIFKVIEDNERVTSEALTDLNDRLDATDENVGKNAEAIEATQTELGDLKDALKSAAYEDVATLEGTMDSKDAATLEAAEEYTDLLFQSIQFATEADIDALFE